jgi:hypothetical protein
MIFFNFWSVFAGFFFYMCNSLQSALTTYRQDKIMEKNSPWKQRITLLRVIVDQQEFGISFAFIPNFPL